MGGGRVGVNRGFGWEFFFKLVEVLILGVEFNVGFVLVVVGIVNKEIASCYFLELRNYDFIGEGLEVINMI